MDDQDARLCWVDGPYLGESNLGERGLVELNDQQAADLMSQGYRVEAVRAEFDAAQAMDMYAARQRVERLRKLVHDFRNRPVTCHWTLADRVVDAGLVRWDQFVMLVEDIRKSVVKSDGEP